MMQELNWELILLVSRLIPAGILILAGIAKLADIKGSRKALLDFGVPSALAPFGAIFLPINELGVGIALIPLATAYYAAWAAAGVFLLFAIAIAFNLLKGRQPDCHCFGQLHSAPIGWSTMVRNVLFAAIPGIIIWSGPEAVGAPVTVLLNRLTDIPSWAILAVIQMLTIFLGVWFMLHLLRQNGRLLIRLEALEQLFKNGPAQPKPSSVPHVGLPLGTKAPSFQLSGIYGETLTQEALLSQGKPLLLVFADPGCGPCNALLPQVAQWQRELMDKVTLAVISRGTVEANRAKSTENKILNVLLQQDREVAQAYQAHGTPSAVLIRKDGMIGSAVASGADAIRVLVSQASGNAMPFPVPATVPNGSNGSGKNGNGNGNPKAIEPLKIGDRVPSIKAEDQGGRLVDFSQFRGRSTLLLFWNPKCGFCTKMIEDLKDWQRNLPANAPRLVIVTAPPIEETLGIGLNAVVVVDSDFSISRKFGATGTPSAIFISADGKIDSGVAGGAPAVLALAQTEVPA